MALPPDFEANFEILHQIIRILEHWQEKLDERYRNLSYLVNIELPHSWRGAAADKFVEVADAYLQALKRLSEAVQAMIDFIEETIKLLQDAEDRAAGLFGSF